MSHMTLHCFTTHANFQEVFLLHPALLSTALTNIFYAWLHLTHVDLRCTSHNQTNNVCKTWALFCSWEADVSRTNIENNIPVRIHRQVKLLVRPFKLEGHPN